MEPKPPNPATAVQAWQTSGAPSASQLLVDEHRTANLLVNATFTHWWISRPLVQSAAGHAYSGLPIPHVLAETRSVELLASMGGCVVACMAR